MSDLVLQKLTLSNFKSFRGEHEFDLGIRPGLYFVSGVNKVSPELGANGVGKSTLWDALTWVLWGKTGRDARPANTVIPWSGKEVGRCCVSLDFKRGGKCYHLARTRKPNTLHLGDNKSGGKDIAQEEVAKVFGMSEEVFRRTMVLGQFGSLFLDLTPEKQSAIFNETLGLDVWLRASEKAASRVKELTKEEQSSELLLKGFAAKLEALEEELEEARTLASKFNLVRDKRITALTEDIERLEARASPLPKKPKRDMVEVAKESRDVASELSAIKREMTDIDVKTAAYKERKCPECGQVVGEKEQKAKITKLKARRLDLEAQLLLVDNKGSMFALELERCKKYVAAEKSQQESFEEVTQLRIRRLDAEQGKNPHKGTVQRLRSGIGDLKGNQQDHQSSLEDVRADLNQVRMWVDGFKEIRLGLIDEALEELEMATNRHAEALGLLGWTLELATERETASGGLSLGFNVRLFPPQAKEPIAWESYSGGEVQRWQLAVAFGLSEVLLTRAGVSPSIEVLDEPTRGLSTEGVDELVEHLQTRATELGRAIFFVDHHSLDRGAFDGCFVVEKSKQGSSVRRI